ncbi:cysteine synthase [Patescibacteria group bacterium]|nr:cysteine synthase [Patescibacteria group bacterium]
MKYFNNLLETIGHTPLVKLNKLAENVKPLILAKLEYFNPGGSVKDRIGIKMILAAEKKGLLKKGGTIVEPTSGNTGVGLALVAALRGYKMIFVMPDKMSQEKELLLRAYGAKVIQTPTTVAPEDPRSYYQVAKKLVKKTPGAFSPNQYFNQHNPQAHFETTGPEIWQDTDGQITHFVAGVGTGGTITGVARYLKQKNPKIKIIGADPEGSIYHHTFYKTKGKIHTYKTEGIGEDFIPKTVDLNLLDEIMVFDDQESFLMTRRLVKEEGLLVGESSGTAVLAALAIAENLTKKDLVVVLLPDTGRNYLSTVFNDDWMKQNNYL